MKNIRSLARSMSWNFSYVTTFLFLQMFTVQKALAEFGGELGNITGLAAGGSGQVRTTVEGIVNKVLGFLALIAVIFVIVGGFRIMMAGGNEENVTKGRKTIIYAVVGLIVIFFARVIVGFITKEIA